MKLRCILFSFIFLLSASHFAHAAETKNPFPLFLEIHEENIDSFPVQGQAEGAESPRPPFWIENGKVVFDVGLAESIRDGEARSSYDLLIAPANFDPKTVKLLVQHEIHFEGKGRDSEIVRFYIFDQLPAVITFEPVNIEKSSIQIDLDENESKLLNIRLTENALKISYDDWSGSLRCEYGALKSVIPTDQLWQISEKSQKISVTRQMVTSHSGKDSALAETTQKNFGEVEFKTKLALKNLGTFPPAGS